MRYFCYNEYVPEAPDGNVIVTMSEEEIQKTFWPYWYEKMCTKYGKDFVDSDYTFEDCLNDWIVVNWAWESK